MRLDNDNFLKQFVSDSEFCEFIIGAGGFSSFLGLKRLQQQKTADISVAVAL